MYSVQDIITILSLLSILLASCSSLFIMTMLQEHDNKFSPHIKIYDAINKKNPHR